MASMHDANRLPDDVDYTVSHRAPPPIPNHPYSHYTGDAALAQAHADPVEGRRRGSFSFLRRNTSHTATAARNNIAADTQQQQLPSTGKTSGEGKMLRKQSKTRAREEQERLQREANLLPQQPPRLPSHNPLPVISSFGGEDARPDSFAIISNRYNTTSSASSGAARANFSRPHNMPSSAANSSSSPAYALRSSPMPGNAFASSSPAAAAARSNGEYVDASERSESMTHRGRYSYTSSNANNVNSPRRVRRRKDPTPFNILVIGAKNSGKTSFISFLRSSLALPSHKAPTNSSPEPSTQNDTKASFTSHYLETEIDGERVGLTLWDSQGLEKHVIDLQLREMTTFIEAKFEDTFTEEQKVMRSPGSKDTHIHCVFLVLDPVRLDTNVTASRSGAAQPVEGLDADLDLQVMKTLQGKTTVIPVISKADTLTKTHMTYLKRAVWESLKAAKLDPLEALGLDEEDEDEEDEEDDSEVDSDELERSDAQLPIQSSNETGATRDDSDIIDNLVDRSSSSASAHTASSHTTPSPVQAVSKEPRARNSHARIPSIGQGINNSVSQDDDPYIPMSILSPDPYDFPPYSSKPPKQVGRLFPWGLADPYNPTHCDFTKLRDSIFSEWRSELREASRVRWYEQWRTSRLKNTPSRQRVKGGVTPVGVVPKEGRTSPKASRNVSGGAIPRSATGGVGQAFSTPGAQSFGKAERMVGVPGSAAGENKGGTYRPVAAYQ